MNSVLTKGAKLEPARFQNEPVSALVFRQTRTKTLLGIVLALVMMFACYGMYLDAANAELPLFGHNPPVTRVVAVLGDLFLLWFVGYSMWTLTLPKGSLALAPLGIIAERRGLRCEIPWGAIEFIKWSALQSSSYLLIQIHEAQLADEIGIGQDVLWGIRSWFKTQPINLAAYPSGPAAIGVAAKYYLAHPQTREELGTAACLSRLQELLADGRGRPDEIAIEELDRFRRQGEGRRVSGTQVPSRLDEPVEVVFVRVNRRIGYRFGQDMTPAQFEALVDELTAPISPFKIFQSQGLNVVLPQGTQEEDMFGCFSGVSDLEAYQRTWVRTSPSANLDLLLNYIRRQLENAPQSDDSEEAVIPYGVEQLLSEWSEQRPQDWVEKAERFWSNRLVRPLLLNNISVAAAKMAESTLEELLLDISLPAEHRERIEEFLEQSY